MNVDVTLNVGRRATMSWRTDVDIHVKTFDWQNTTLVSPVTRAGTRAGSAQPTADRVAGTTLEQAAKRKRAAFYLCVDCVVRKCRDTWHHPG